MKRRKIETKQRKPKPSATKGEKGAVFTRLTRCLDHLNDTRGITDAAIAEELGVNRSTPSRWRGGAERPLNFSLPTSAVLLSMGTKFGISAEFILTGRGPMLRADLVASGGELETMIRARLENAISDASTPDLPMDHGRTVYERAGLQVGRDVGERPSWEVDAAAALAWLTEHVVQEAKALHQWRAAWSAMAQLHGLPLYTELAPESGEFHRVRIDIGARLPAPPDLRVVRGL